MILEEHYDFLAPLFVCSVFTFYPSLHLLVIIVTGQPVLFWLLGVKSCSSFWCSCFVIILHIYTVLKMSYITINKLIESFIRCLDYIGYFIASCPVYCYFGARSRKCTILLAFIIGDQTDS